jgi:hypothetical protein
MLGWFLQLVILSCCMLTGLLKFWLGILPGLKQSRSPGTTAPESREEERCSRVGFQRSRRLRHLRLSLACAGELVGFDVIPIVTSQHEPQVRLRGMGPDRVAPLARPAAKPASSQEGFQGSHFHGRSISSLSYAPAYEACGWSQPCCWEAIARGCPAPRSLSSALASNWRTRSRVIKSRRPTSCNVRRSPGPSRR